MPNDVQAPRRPPIRPRHLAADDVGIVQPRDFVHPGPFTFKSGQTIPGFTLRYETYGSLNATRDNAILDMPRAERRPPLRRLALAERREARLVEQPDRARQGGRHPALLRRLRQRARGLPGLDRAELDRPGDRPALRHRGSPSSRSATWSTRRSSCWTTSAWPSSTRSWAAQWAG